MPRLVSIAATCCLAALWNSSAAAQAPTPVEPIAAILAAFKAHSLVEMSDAHGNEQNHEFRLALIRDPRFPSVVNDIVLELGNALYQNVADRYVGGEDVPYTEIRQIWENTIVQTGGNNYLMIEELFRVVRDVMESGPHKRGLVKISGATRQLSCRAAPARSDREAAPSIGPVRPFSLSEEEHLQQLHDGLLASADARQLDRGGTEMRAK